MTNPRRSTMILISLSLALIGVPIPSAQGQPDNGACDRNDIRLWIHANSQGCFTDISTASEPGKSPSEDDFRKNDYETCRGTSLNDSVSSYQNNSSFFVVLYEHPKQKGFAYCIAAHASGNIIPGMNDKASSIDGVDAKPDEGAIRKGCNHYDRD